MKVKCVCTNGWISYVTKEDIPGPSYGEVCTVVDDKEVNSEKFYQLENYGVDWYAAKAFVPVDDFGEQVCERIVKELQEEKELVESILNASWHDPYSKRTLGRSRFYLQED